LAHCAILTLLFAACNSKSQTGFISQESVITDSFINSKSNYSANNPGKTRHEIVLQQQQTGDSTNYYRLEQLKAKYYFIENILDSAIIASKKIIEFCNRTSGQPGIDYLTMATFNDLSIMWQTSGKRDSAITCLHQAEKIAIRAGLKEKLIDIYINLADNLNQESNFPQAAATYRKALLIADSLGLHSNYSAPINLGLANLYIDLGNYELAGHYFVNAETYFDSLPPLEQLYFANSRGNYYYHIKQYEKSLQWFNRSYELGEKYNQQYYMDLADINRGELYLLMEDYEMAKKYLEKASIAFGTTESSPAVKFYLNGLYASLYLATNQIDKAEYYLSQPFDTAHVNSVYILSHNKRMEELFQKKGDYKKAYAFSKNNNELDNNLRKSTVQNNIEELNFRYSQDTTLLKKDIEIRHHRQKATQLSNTLIISSSLFTIAILTTIFIIILRKRRNEKLLSMQIETINRLRLDNIKNRMSPHFIFNALNAMIPNFREHPELNRPVELLVGSIRNSLTASDKIGIEAAIEIRNVQNYLELLQSLNYDLPQVMWNIDRSVDLSTKIPSMCIQIPVENTIKYAFDNHDGNNILKINIKQNNNQLLLEIKDNGVGLNNRQQNPNNSKGTGSGLKILHKTVETFNNRNQSKIEMDIKSAGTDAQSATGTVVTYKIPANYKFEL
jgi:tetratricopeptide (TPR) repeat protein